MSAVFGLDATEQRQQFESLTADWDGQNDFSAGTFEGMLPALGDGTMRGAVKTVGALRNTATGINAALGTITEAEADDRFRAADEDTKLGVDYWTPNVNEVGKVGQTLGMLGEMVLPLALTRGDPKLLALSQSMSTSQDLVQQGVDADTAGTVGTVEAGATMLGAWLPMLGGTLAKRVAGNAVANTVVGAGTTAIEGSILEGAGYDKQAAPFDPFDAQARVVDAVMGAAFGALYKGQQADMRAAVFGEKGAARVQRATDSALESLGLAMKPSDMDAAFSGANIKHLQIDSAAGRPANAESWSAHSNAIDKALDQVTNGEAVSVGASLDGTTFLGKRPNDRSAFNEITRDADDLDMPTNRADVEPLGEFVAESDTGTAKVAKEEAAQSPEQVADEAEIAAIDQHIAEHGDFDVAIATGDDGDGSITRPASELLASADEQLQEATTMGKGILAAAKCFMSFGQ